MADNQTPPAATDYSGVREYIGARYVPVFANPPEWNDTRGYEPLTIVLHEGNSFTSTQYVPTGIDINNTKYWLETGNWNAQIEAYREEVLRFDGRITQNEENIADNMAAIAEEVKNRQTAIAEEVTNRQAAIAAEQQARISSDNALALRMDNIEKATPLDDMNGRHAVFIGDSFMAASASYPQKLAYFVSQLLGWTMHNYAVGGTGWYDEGGVGMNFLHQLEDAAAKITVPTNQVSYVVIGGGFNDWNDPTPLTYSQLYSSALDTVIKAHQLFPNAEIVCIPMMFRNYGVDVHMHDLYSAITAGINASNTPVMMITDAYLWQLGFKNVDGVHPTVELYKIMAEYVVSWILGGGVKTSRLYSVSNTVNGLDCRIEFISTAGVVTACVSKCKVTSTISSGSQITVASQVPLFASSSTTQRIPIMNASGAIIGQFVFSGSSMLFIAHTNLTAAQYAGNSVSYPLWVKSPQ